jgi:hypothetical protein
VSRPQKRPRAAAFFRSKNNVLSEKMPPATPFLEKRSSALPGWLFDPSRQRPVRSFTAGPEDSDIQNRASVSV